MLSLWRKYFPKRQTVDLFHKDKRVGVVFNALCDKQSVDVCQFLTSNIRPLFHRELSAAVLSLVCCSLRESQTSYADKGFYDIILLYVVLQLITSKVFTLFQVPSSFANKSHII